MAATVLMIVQILIDIYF